MVNSVLYTDGSASIRPDGTFYCGYAYVFVVDGAPVIGKAFPGMGTINQAEMCAVYAGVKEALELGINVTAVYTDSTYVVNGLDVNYEKYDTNEWTNSQGSEVSNKEMWVNLIEFTRKNNIKIPAIHIKGHTGQPFNELCDKLAKEAAMSQLPVYEYCDIDKCRELGFCIPSTVEPIPVPAVRSEDPVCTCGEVIGTLSRYTDDRAKCCYIKYPGLLDVFASKGVSIWKTVETTDDINMSYSLHPVSYINGEGTMPLYRYMTESGTPFEVVTHNSTVQWQGLDFNNALKNAISKIDDGSDLIIATHNLASAKKYQGIYFAKYSWSTGEGCILDVYRTERIPHGKYMCIPNGYLTDLSNNLNRENTEVGSGLVTSTSNMCLVVTSDEGGMIIGSSVIPHTITIEDIISLIAERSGKTNVRILDQMLIQVGVLARAIDRVVPAEDLSLLIPYQDYQAPVGMDAMSKGSDGNIKEYVQSPGDNFIISEDPIYNNDPATVDEAIAMYAHVSAQIKELIERQHHLFDIIVGDRFKYTEPSPDKVQEIEQRVISDMKKKFDSIFS